MIESEDLPPIVIPRRLTYASSRTLAAEQLPRTLGAIATTFDWSNARYATLPEIVTLLNWSARLRKLQKHVMWTFKDPTTATTDEAIRFVAGLGEREGVVDEVTTELLEIRAAIAARQLYSRSRVRKLEQLRRRLTTKNAQSWFDEFADALLAADLLGYLHRYDVFARASAVGVEITPDPLTLAFSKMGAGTDTATIALRPISSVVDVDTTVKELNDPATLARILGKYVGLDIVRRGGLANVVVRELGNNVDDHADASAAWLCTRAVAPSELDPDDPVDQIYSRHKTGFFELIVCDNGVGLTAALKDVLLSDNRLMTRRRYAGARAGDPTTQELIDYAFERLSSSAHRQDLLTDDTDDTDEAEGVASGLYWIWNLVRGRRGTICVRTAGHSAHYDLIDRHNSDDPPMPTDELFACEGTFIRVCFPLVDSSELDKSKQQNRDDDSARNMGWRYHHVQIGDLSRVTAALPPAGKDSDRTLTPQQVRLLAKLHERHDEIASGDVLILDLIGMRRQWDKKTALPPSHFFFRTNYTSTAGRSTAVLWNVPQSSIDVFEQAVETVAHFKKTKDNSRFAFMVSERGELRLFCGWREAEELFARFTHDAEELTLEQLGIVRLSGEDQSRFIAGVRENTHLFEYIEHKTDRDQSVVRLRPWIPSLRAAVWKSNSDWFAAALDTPVDRGGLLKRLPPGEGYFRLPSTDLLSRDFYHFRRFFSDQQAFARISWSMFQIVSRVVPRVPDFIIAVSRPAAALARNVAQEFVHLGSERTPELLVADHVEHLRTLRRDHDLNGKTAVVLMTAISTGTQAAQIATVFATDQIEWLGTFVCLDVRGTPVVKTLPLTLDMQVEQAEPVITGPVYSLARRFVEKVEYGAAKAEPIISIDPVNVCPVQLPPEMSGADVESIFKFITDDHVLGLGHFDSDQYHHYLYFVNFDALLRHPDGLLNHIVRHIIDTAFASEYDADRTVLLFPPPPTSSAHVIASEVQQYLGARYEFALYRDTFAGEWRFSPFALHGLPLNNATVIIVDDGSNTGETLLGLLHAATIGGTPARIRAYLGLERLPPQKARLFRSLRSVAECGDVRVWSAAQLAIPVYTPRDCPVCRLRRDLARIEDRAGLLQTVAGETLRLLKPQRTSASAARFLWRYTGALSATRLREELEVCEFDVDADRRLDARLRAIVQERSCAALLDLAFVLCAEPDLIRSRAVMRHYKALVSITPAAVADCAQRSEAATIACFAYYVTTRIDGDVDTEDELIDKVVSALMKREDASPRLVGQVICVIAAEAISADVVMSKVRTPIAWLNRFRDRKARVSTEPAGLTAAFGALYAREALAAVKGEPVQSHVPEPFAHDDLIALITLVASKMYRHSAKTSESHVSKLLSATRLRIDWRPESITPHVHALLVTIDELEELRARLYVAEVESIETKETLDILPDWYTPQINASVRDIVDALHAIAELLSGNRSDVESRLRARNAAATVATEFERLTRATDLAFDALFPRPFRAMDVEREKFARKNPEIGKLIAVKSTIDKRESVYFPLTLLERFMDAAFENLATAAFSGLPSEQLRRATVTVHLNDIPASADTPRQIAVTVEDNGPIYSDSDRTEPSPFVEFRGNRALSDLTALAPRFFGKVERREENGKTRVTLTIRAYKKPDVSTPEELR